MSFKDETGAVRHSLNGSQLETIYRELDEFRADLTPEEYKEAQSAFVKIFALIHQRIRNNN